jgi:molybdenum cofactor cytidylyltransferase
MKDYKIGAVIVAAGLSSRMKNFKPLMPIGNKKMIETTIRNYQSIGVDEIIVVTGFRANDIEKQLKREDIKFARNNNYADNHMFDSVCIGLKQIADLVDYAFITPVDSPFVQKYTLEKMLNEIAKKEINITRPYFEGKNGHPILAGGKAIKVILEHDGKEGLRGAIAKMESYHKSVPVIDPGIVMDADTTYDYLKLLEYEENRRCPSVEICKKIQEYFNVPDKVIRHSGKVAEVASNICQYLWDEKGVRLNKKIIIAASLLHDIAKGRKKHEKIAAKWLQDMGYSEVSKIVAEHMNLLNVPEIPTEKEVVYLADKMVKGDSLVSIDERFSYKEELYKNDRNLLEVVKNRKKQAFTVYDLVYGDKMTNIS